MPTTPETFKHLSIEQKIGQLFFIGLPGPELDGAAKTLVKDIQPGGVCLFARNIRTAEQTRNLIDKINEQIAIPPLLSIDQEGGLVDRLRRLLTPMPSARALEQRGTPEDVETLAKIIAEALRILGFNLDFAPVVDIITADREHFDNALYMRIFGSTTQTVTKLAGTFLETLQDGGILGCLKHFPGLGASSVDSHLSLPFSETGRAELFETDLAPYRDLFARGGVHAVMVAHATFPSFDLQEKDSDGKLLPSSLSRQIIEQLLRDELGYRGLAITDDLEMGAILKNYSFGEACKMAIQAGEDMLILSSNPDGMYEGYQSLLNAVESGTIPEQRIDEALSRIFQLKERISPPSDFDLNRLNELSAEINELNAKLNYSYGG